MDNSQMLTLLVITGTVFFFFSKYFGEEAIELDLNSGMTDGVKVAIVSFVSVLIINWLFNESVEIDTTESSNTISENIPDVFLDTAM